jgi:hypothetical protein
VIAVALLLGSIRAWVIATNGSRVDASSEHSTPRGGGVARDRLARELVEARKIALRYPTVADVTAAGYKRLGMFSPGAGAHFVDSGSVGGRFQATSGWMLHVWVIPGRESPTGVFSHNNPDLHCADGSDDHDEIGYCPGT